MNSKSKKDILAKVSGKSFKSKSEFIFNFLFVCLIFTFYLLYFIMDKLIIPSLECHEHSKTNCYDCWKTDLDRHLKNLQANYEKRVQTLEEIKNQTAMYVTCPEQTQMEKELEETTEEQAYIKSLLDSLILRSKNF